MLLKSVIVGSASHLLFYHIDLGVDCVRVKRFTLSLLESDGLQSHAHLTCNLVETNFRTTKVR